MSKLSILVLKNEPKNESPRFAIEPHQLDELLTEACSGGDDPVLDFVLLWSMAEMACRRESLLNLRVSDRLHHNQSVRLCEKNDHPWCAGPNSSPSKTYSRSHDAKSRHFATPSCTSLPASATADDKYIYASTKPGNGRPSLPTDSPESVTLSPNPKFRDVGNRIPALTCENAVLVERRSGYILYVDGDLLTTYGPSRRSTSTTSSVPAKYSGYILQAKNSVFAGGKAFRRTRPVNFGLASQPNPTTTKGLETRTRRRQPDHQPALNPNPTPQRSTNRIVDHLNAHVKQAG